MESSAPARATASASPAGLLLWLRRHPVFPLLVACAGSSLLSVILLVGRKLMTGQGRLVFIPFNLVLAFLPLAFLGLRGI